MNKKKVVILQSNYVPWKGYFHLIQKADYFVFLDSVQYTPRDWRNRNQFITPNGLKWLTVPVHGHQSLMINQVKIDMSQKWQKQHYEFLNHNYKKAPYFNQIQPLLEEIYLNQQWIYLSELNQFLIKKISSQLGLNTVFYNDREFPLINEKHKRIINIIKELGAEVYLTGPKALSYLDPNYFYTQDIRLEVMTYPSYPDYPQLWNIQEQKVSILDLLFHQGNQAGNFIWGKNDSI